MLLCLVFCVHVLHCGRCCLLTLSADVSGVVLVVISSLVQILAPIAWPIHVAHRRRGNVHSRNASKPCSKCQLGIHVRGMTWPQGSSHFNMSKIAHLVHLQGNLPSEFAFVAGSFAEVSCHHFFIREGQAICT